jgi:hypothetical protein
MSWAGKELATAELGDERRVLRLMKLVERFVERAEQSIPQGFGSWSETKAAYRFLENPQIAAQEILAPHRTSTVQRAAQEPVVLVAQDTTEINLTSFAATTGLGYLSLSKRRGVLLHSCLAVTPQGVVLGVLDQQLWVRPEEELGKRHARRQKPTSAQESQRWLTGWQATQTALADHPQVVMIADREADIYDLFAEARPSQMHLLVRVSREQRRVEHAQKYLRQAVESSAVGGVLTIEVPRHGQQPPRTAQLHLRWSSLAIRPPRWRTAGLPLQQLQFVLAEEAQPPEGEKAIRWLLATTLPVANATDAATCVEYYTRRWLIERFHYTLKSGCLVEQRRFENVESISRAIACFSIVAWRLLWLMTEAREHPEQPCSLVLSQPESEALEAVAQQRYGRTPQAAPPTLHEAVQLIGKLGGHLGRRRDGPPGVKTLWRGLTVLSYVTTGWLLPRGP